MVKPTHLQSSMFFHHFNVYMPNTYKAKAQYWEYLLGIEGMEYAYHCIIFSDFNTTINIKREGDP